MPDPEVIVIRRGDNFNYEAYFRSLAYQKLVGTADDKEMALTREAGVIDYLSSEAAANDPRAMELLCDSDGYLNEGIYWGHLKHCAQDPVERERVEHWLETEPLIIRRMQLVNALKEAETCVDEPTGYAWPGDDGSVDEGRDKAAARWTGLLIQNVWTDA